MKTKYSTKKSTKGERGAVYVEYAMAAGVLIAVFVVASKLLTTAVYDRNAKSTEAVVTSMPPCGPHSHLHGDGCL